MQIISIFSLHLSIPELGPTSSGVQDGHGLSTRL